MAKPKAVQADNVVPISPIEFQPDMFADRKPFEEAAE